MPSVRNPLCPAPSLSPTYASHERHGIWWSYPFRHRRPSLTLRLRGRQVRKMVQFSPPDVSKVSKSLTHSVARGVILKSNEMPTSGGSSPQWHPAIIADSVRLRFSQGLLLLLAICFVLQAFSPLRLNTDAIVLLSMGDSTAHGGGFLDSGQKTVFPPGYPALLAILLRLGIAHSWVLVGLNLVFLSLGLFAAYSLLIRQFFEDRALVLVICSFFLLSYVVVKHFTIPLTDVPFFCCSMCCLAVMSHTANVDSNWLFGMLAGTAWLLAFAAITVRTIGVALFPPLLVMLVSSSQFKL